MSNQHKNPTISFRITDAERKQIEARILAYTVMMKKVKMVSAISISVLITGENGSGKEHVAQAIHEHGNRSSKPFIAVDCGTLPKELSASALFGHKRGAFTGATEDKVGFFGQANGGTLFLDEIGNLSMEAQVMLLRLLQEQIYRPVGSERDEHCRVRCCPRLLRNG